VVYLFISEVPRLKFKSYESYNYIKDFTMSTESTRTGSDMGQDSVDEIEFSTSLTVEDALGEPEEKRAGFDGFEDYEEIERYWVMRPYAYISILYSEQEENYIYYIVEPQMDEFEQLLREEISSRLRDKLMVEDIDESETNIHSVFTRREDILIEKALGVAKDYGVGIQDTTLHKVLYYAERDFIRYGQIEPIMQDPNIEDVSCDGFGVPVYVFHRSRQDIETNIRFERQELNTFITRLAQQSGKHVSAANPLVDASLPDGSRAQLVLGKDVATRGSSFTIRKFRDEPLTPIELIDFGTFDLKQMSYLWMAIENDMSLIFAGGTGSGKTTSMNSVSLFIPPKKKVVTIEDTREIQLPHENWVPLLTRGAFGATQGQEGAVDDNEGGDVSMYELLRGALRMRPEYLLVGEVRGSEARTLFQAMNTGHTTYSTFHADSVESLLQRFRNPPINVPDQMLNALDIVSVQEQIRVEGERQRRNRTIAEIEGQSPDGEEIVFDNYFNYVPEEDMFNEIGVASRVLDKIADKKELSLSEVREERSKRRKVLEYMLENDITDYTEVTRIVQAFMINEDSVLDKIEDGSLSGDSFKELETIGDAI
jgi:flagellar protein FlaI